MNRRRGKLVIGLAGTILFGFTWGSTVAAQGQTGADVVFLAGTTQFKQRGANGDDSAPWGPAVGLRFGTSPHRQWQAMLDLRLQAAGFRGPCTRDEAQRGECHFKQGAQSLGDAGLSLGGTLAVHRSIRLGALMSPGLIRRGWDRTEGSGHANRAASPPSMSGILEWRRGGGVGVLLEYRRFKHASYMPDSQAEIAANAGAIESSGSSLTIATILPLKIRPHSAPIRAAPSFTSYGLTVENDTPMKDESYSNGIRLTVGEVPGFRALAGRLSPFRRLLAKNANQCPSIDGVSIAGPNCVATQLSVTQTIHTPDSLDWLSSDRRLDSLRAYAGTLFLSMNSDVIYPAREHSAFRILSSEIQLGMLGPSARSAQTQSMAHWLLSTNATRPAGWRSQLPNRVHVQWLLQGAAEIARLQKSNGLPGRRAELLARASLMLGSNHINTGFGGIGRFSLKGDLPGNLQRSIAPAFIPDAIRDSSIAEVPVSTKIALIATADARFVGYNHLLSHREVDRKASVGELGFGVQVDRGVIGANFLMIWRTPEFSMRSSRPQGNSRYWTLQFTYRPRR